MSIEKWQAMPAPEAEDLRPILSSLTDQRLEQNVAAELGIGKSDSLFSFLFTDCVEFQMGRLVVINSLRPDLVTRKADVVEEQYVPSRWFRAAEMVLRVKDQKSQGCYGGWHDGVSVKVFGS
jgi:hypothetical protein